jgi:hypothetical protein
LGDVNGDGRTNNFDVVPFGGILSPAGQTAYKAANPNLNFLRGDINGNGTLTTADTALFGQVLFNSPPATGSGAGLSGGAVPEPASIALVCFGIGFVGLARRRRLVK